MRWKLCFLMMIVVAGMMLGGCAGMNPNPPAPPPAEPEILESYQYDPSKSFALNVLQATNPKRALSFGDYQPTEQGKERLMGILSFLGSAAEFAVFAATGSTLTQSLGMSTGATAGLWAAGKANGKDINYYNSHIFSWVPQDDRTRDQVIAEERQVVQRALFDAVDLLEWPEVYQVNDSIITPSSGDISRKITGGMCDDSHDCFYTAPRMRYAEPAMFPSFVNHEGSAWYISDNLLKRTSIYRKSWETKFPILPDLNVYVKMSELLPPDYFIYLTPRSHENVTGILSDDGKTEILSVPVILNRGKIFYFIAPEV